jgi:hypothetical protein
MLVTDKRSSLLCWNVIDDKKCFEILTADDEAHGICKFQLHQEQAGQSTFIFI